jgi:hypothetical protein
LLGSLRKASFSRAALVGLRDNVPEKVTLDILDLPLPLYNENDDRTVAKRAHMRTSIPRSLSASSMLSICSARSTAFRDAETDGEILEVAGRRLHDNVGRSAIGQCGAHLLG